MDSVDNRLSGVYHMSMFYIIAGGRDFADYNRLAYVCDRIIRMDKAPPVVLSGGCRGADQMGKIWAEKAAILCDVYHANWDKHGKAAGPIRNQKMVDAADALIAFWDGESRGTKDVIKRAAKARLNIHLYYY